jgi:hypothetical protein
MSPPAETTHSTAPAPASDLVVGVGLAGLGFMLGSLGSCLILLARDLSVPRGELSFLSAGFGVGLLVLGLAGPRLLGLGAWRLMGVSAASLAFGATLLALSAWILVAQAGALLIGLGGAGIVLAYPTLLAGPNVAQRLTRVNAASSLAGIGAPLLISLADGVASHGRWALLLPVPWLIWLAWRSLAAATAAPDPGGTQPAGGSPLPPAAGGAGFARPRAWLPRFVSIVASVSPEFAFVVWGAARLQDSGLTPTAAAAAAVAFPLGMGAGRLIAPALLGRVPVVGAGVALASGCACLAAAPVGPALATVALCGAGLGIAALYPVMLTRLLETPGLGFGPGAALGSLASGTAVLAAPVLLNALAGQVSLRAAFVAVVPALLLVLALQPRADRARPAA